MTGTVATALLRNPRVLIVAALIATALFLALSYHPPQKARELVSSLNVLPSICNAAGAGTVGRDREDGKLLPGDVKYIFAL